MTRQAAAVVVEIVTLAIVSALAIAGAAVWGLGAGRINADFLRIPAEEVFAQAFEGRQIDIGAIESEWSAEDRAVIVTAHDMTLRGADGAVQVQAERLAAALPAVALIRRSFRPVWLEAEGGAFTLMRDAEGQFSAQLGPPPGPQSAAPGGLAAPLARDEGGGADTLTGIDALSLSGATLYVIDAPAGLRWRIADAALDYRNDEDGVAAEASGWLVQPGGRAELHAQARTGPGGEHVEVDIEVEGFNGAQSGPERGPLAALSLIDAPADVAARLTAAMDGRLENAALDVTVGEGRLLLASGGSPLRSAALDLLYDAAARRVTVRSAHVDAERAQSAAEGWVEGPDADGAFAYDLTFQDATVSFGGVFERPPSARRIVARGSFQPGPRQARLDALDVDLGSVTARLTGQAALVTEDGRTLPDLALAGPIEGEGSVADVLRYWPVAFAKGGRDWIADHVLEGRVREAALDLEISPQDIAHGAAPDDALALSFRVEDGVVRYLTAMPEMTEAAGQAVLRGNSFALTLERGRIGDIELTGGQIDLPRLAPRGAVARISGTAQGEAADMLALLDHDPLNLTRTFGVEPASVGGRGEISFDIYRPMRRSVSARRIGFDIRGEFEDVSAPGPGEGMDITDGRVSLQAGPEGLIAAGPARVGPVEATIEWRETFFSGDAPGTRFTLEAGLDQADFDALGVPLRAFVDGPTPVTVRTVGNGLEIAAAEVEADLTAAALSAGSWAKPAGAPGAARFTFGAGEVEGTTQIGDIDIAAEGLELRGAALLGADGRLIEAGVAPLRAAGYADLDRAEVSRDGETLNLSLAGDYLNLQDFVGQLWSGAGAGGLGAPVALDAQIAELTLSPAAQLRDALLSASHDGEVLQAVSLDARTDGGALRARLFPTGGEARTLEATSEDAGLLFQALFGVDQVRGGTLDLSGASSAPGAPWRFDVAMTDFTLVQAPILARMLSLASLPGLADALAGGGIGFSELHVPAEADAGRITLDEARATGSSLGVTVDGQIDLARRELALDGAIAPALPVNRVLGDMLGAREGEGLFAFAYTVEGPFNATQIFVNPLSGIAPGFLRRLFEGDPELSEDAVEPEGDGAEPPAEPDAAETDE